LFCFEGRDKQRDKLPISAVSCVRSARCRLHFHYGGGQRLVHWEVDGAFFDLWKCLIWFLSWWPRGRAADRIIARILFKVVRAGSGGPAMYSSRHKAKNCRSGSVHELAAKNLVPSKDSPATAGGSNWLRELAAVPASVLEQGEEVGHAKQCAESAADVDEFELAAAGAARNVKGD
jgi:hypothetical protein